MRKIWIGAAVFVVTCIAGAVWGYKLDLTSDKWASWVQAVGSIGAILAAAGVVVSQHELELARVRRESAAKLQQMYEAAFQIVGGAAQIGAKAASWAGNQGQLMADLEPVHYELSVLVDALHKIDVMKFDRFIAIEAALVAKVAGGRLLRSLAHAIASPGMKNEDREHLLTAIGDRNAELKQRAQALDAIIQELKKSNS